MQKDRELNLVPEFRGCMKIFMMEEDGHEDHVLVLLFLFFVLANNPKFYGGSLKQKTSQTSSHQQSESFIHMLTNLTRTTTVS